MVTIREGGYYQDTNGVKRGPMEDYATNDGFPFTITNDECGWWSEDGRAQSDSAVPDLDLIAEWTGPVRTVTRREVVEGVYDQVTVGSKLFDSRGRDTVGVFIDANLTRDQLRAAAAVLLELAGALDSE